MKLSETLQECIDIKGNVDVMKFTQAVGLASSLESRCELAETRIKDIEERLRDRGDLIRRLEHDLDKRDGEIEALKTQRDSLLTLTNSQIASAAEGSAAFKLVNAIFRNTEIRKQVLTTTPLVRRDSCGGEYIESHQQSDQTSEEAV